MAFSMKRSLHSQGTKKKKCYSPGKVGPYSKKLCPRFRVLDTSHTVSSYGDLPSRWITYTYDATLSWSLFKSRLVSSLHRQGRSQPFCMERFLMYIACPTGKRGPEALFTRGVWRHAPSVNFWILRLQKWRFLDFEQKVSITSAQVSISKEIVNIAFWRDGP